MAKMAEGKKTKSTGETARPQDGSVGEMLRAARVAKNLSIEDVSVALRIRAAQLRVIEENNIDALPGMTYAVGFVRSYANYVGLDGTEIAHRFKAEYGRGMEGHSKLSFPEPVAESRMPDPIMVGIGAFLAIVVLVAWTVYSNAHSGADKIAEQAAPVLAVTAASDTPGESLLSPTPEKTPEKSPEAAVASAPAAVVAAGDGKKEAVAAAEPPKEAAESHDAVAPPAEEAKAGETGEKAAEKAPEKKHEETAADKKEESGEGAVITIKAGKSRIMLQSNQSSWVQVTDVTKGTLYKKVLKAGEQYHVPDQPGLSLATANAGGLDVYVDGQKVSPLGRMGEIIRGVALDPSSLKRKKIRVND